MTHWSDDATAITELSQRAQRAVAARVGLEDATVREAVLKAFHHAGERPHIPDIGRARAAVDALGVRHPRLAADLRPVVRVGFVGAGRVNVGICTDKRRTI